MCIDYSIPLTGNEHDSKLIELVSKLYRKPKVYASAYDKDIRSRL